MTRAHFAKHFKVALWCALFGLPLVGAQFYAEPVRANAAPSQPDSLSPRASTSSQAKPAGQSKTQKLTNPLNDLLDEAQRYIDQKQFDAAIAPLQKVIAEEPGSG